MSLLRIEKLVAGYGAVDILNGIDLAVEPGRISVIVGPNGAGKSTAMKAIFGLAQVRDGRILFNEDDVTRLPADKLVAQGIAYVPQERNVFRSLSVRENLLMPTSVLARSARASSGGEMGQRWDFNEVLKEFPQLAERINHPGGLLSGGEQQMLAIGRALMANPELILMDEPSEGLSPRLVQQAQEIMQRLRSRGHAILLVEQNLQLALSVADEIYVLSSGRFVFQGTPAELAKATQILDQHLGVSDAKIA